MGNNQSFEQNGKPMANVVPPRPAPPVPNANVYPNLDNGDHDYEILNPPGFPTRPAPKPPAVTHQHSTHTLSNNLNGLEGVPFIINPRFLTSSNNDKVI